MSPLDFWKMTPVDIFHLGIKHENDFREAYEKESFVISWLTAPHVKNPLKMNKIFDFEELKRRAMMTEDEEFEEFEEMIMDKTEKLARQRNKITNHLKEINKRKAEAAKVG